MLGQFYSSEKNCTHTHTQAHIHKHIHVPVSVCVCGVLVALPGVVGPDVLGLEPWTTERIQHTFTHGRHR